MPRKSQGQKSSSTESNKYKSIYREGYVTEACYIVELLFSKRSEVFNSGRYPESFWNTKAYKGQFTGQIIQANKLLKKYSGLSIISALKSPKAKGVIKLQDSKLIPIIEEFEKNKVDTTIVHKEEIKTEVAKPFGNRTNRLADL